MPRYKRVCPVHSYYLLGRLNHKLIVRPTNIASSKAHQRLTASVVQRHKREKKIKIVVTEADPELDKQKKEQVSLLLCYHSF